MYDKDSEDRVDNQGNQGNQGRQRNRQSNSGGGRQQGNQQRRARGVETDGSGAETLTGKALQFRQYVERYEVDWGWFLKEILETDTLQAYFDSGGTAPGAVEAFRQYAADQGIDAE